MDVGIRELRNGLSRHLEQVRAGHSVTITDHGVPVARIVPIGRLTRLEQLRLDGRVQPASRRKEPAPEPLAIDTIVSDLIDDQRP